MRARMAAVALVLWGLSSPAAHAQDCAQPVQSTGESLEMAKRQMAMISGQQRRRTEEFMADAERLLNEARAECDSAKTALERSYAIAKTLVAQGNLAAAQLFIKGNPF